MASSTFPSVDLISNKTKQNKTNRKAEFSAAAAAAFLLVCLIENQQRFTVTFVSFLFIFVSLFSIVGSSFWLLLAFIVCVYRDTRQGRGFRSDFPPFVFVLQIKK